MNINKIIVPLSVRYISEWLDFNLPQGHCIINKTVCGCGFTEYCLNNKLNVILCSPRVSLLENKEEQNPQCFRLKPLKDLTEKRRIDLGLEDDVAYGNYVFDQQLHLVENYINQRTILNINTFGKDGQLKFLVTYDSLPILFKIFQLIGINTSNFYIIVDEFQNIFIDSRFKADVELNFVEYLQDCPNVIYLSATPMMKEYLDQMEEFRNLPYYELVWPSNKIIKPRITRIKTKSIYESVCKVIQNYKEGNFPKIVTPDGIVHESKEVVFFVNNVTMICNLLKKSSLTVDEVNVVCSNCKKNIDKLKKVKHKIGTIPLKGEPHKMFTFCTRTTYLGADFYSTCASTVIISDCNISSLSLDISLDLPQIIGRQRLSENIFRYEVTIFYKRLKDVYSKSEFNKYIDDKINQTNEIIQLFNSGNKIQKDSLVKNWRTIIKIDKYINNYIGISDKTGCLANNKLVLLSEIRAFEVQQINYRDDINVYNELSKVSTVNNIEEEVIKFLDQFNLLTTFKSSLKFFCEYPFIDESIKVLILFRIPKEYQNYYYLLGPSRCKALGYQKSKLDEEIKKNTKSIKEDNSVLIQQIKVNFKIGKRYTLKEIKEKLREIYTTLHLSKTPKASDLEEFFEVKKTKITTDNDGIKDGYLIVKLKTE